MAARGGAQRRVIESEIKRIEDELLGQKLLLRHKLKYERIRFLFPDKGPLRRDLYAKTLAWFEAGSRYLQRVIFGGNRTGKTEAGAFEVACHATGNYPKWWKGRRFDGPTSGVVAGKDLKTVRNTVQMKLLGYPEREIGTGMIPRRLLILEACKRASGGVANLFDTIVVRHEPTGGRSTIYVKAYDQGRTAFEGTKLHYVWEDEEAPQDIHGENLARVFDTQGIVFNTYTPLKGQTELTRDLRKRAHDDEPTAFMTTIAWDDVPHITPEMIKAYQKLYKPHEMKARRWGIPKMGAGSIFTTDFDDVLVVKPFKIPPYWPKAFGLDFGWSPHPTAAVWGAWDRDSDTVYLYSEHRMQQELPSVHVDAIKARGAWIKGNSETAGGNASDGEKMIKIYCNMGLNLIKADKKSKEANIHNMRQRVETGRLRVFNTMPAWREEYESYHRDELGKVVDEYDDLMDATLYLLSRMQTFTTEPLSRVGGRVAPTQFGDYRI